MMTTYWKAVRPDGFDFHSGTVRWLPPVGEPLPDGGLVVRHPTARRWANGAGAAAYLSVATVPTDCTGMRWPCRLAEVEKVPGYGVHETGDYPHKRAAVAWRVVRDVDAHLALGPQGVEVAAIIERASRLTADEMTRLYAAWAAARVATWDATWAAARDATIATRDAAWAAARVATWDATWGAASDAAWGAAIATLVRDLITDEQYQTIAGPWLSVIGEVQS